MSAKQTANGHNHALYDCFRVSPPEDSETAASKAGLLAHASSYSEAFPYGKQRKPSVRTVAISFRPHWQLRGQLRIPTGFPIKPFRHLAASLWNYSDMDNFYIKARFNIWQLWIYGGWRQAISGPLPQTAQLPSPCFTRNTAPVHRIQCPQFI